MQTAEFKRQTLVTTKNVHKTKNECKRTEISGTLVSGDEEINENSNNFLIYRINILNGKTCPLSILTLQKAI